MPRLNTVEHARKAQGTCGRCGVEIKVGDPYKWVKSRRGPRRVRCGTCPPWRPSELTSSSQLATLYAAQEAFGDAQPFETIEDAAQALRDMADEVRSAGEAYGESASNIVDGFGHDTYVSEEIQEKADACESWADDLERAADDVEGTDTDVCDECGDTEEEHGTEEDPSTSGEDHDFEPKSLEDLIQEFVEVADEFPL